MHFFSLGRLGHQGSTESFYNFARATYFFGWFFHIFMDKTNKNVSVLCIVRSTIKVDSHKNEDNCQFQILSILFAIKIDYSIQNWLCMPEYKVIVIIVLGIYNFCEFYPQWNQGNIVRQIAMRRQFGIQYFLVVYIWTNSNIGIIQCNILLFHFFNFFNRVFNFTKGKVTVV